MVATFIQPFVSLQDKIYPIKNYSLKENLNKSNSNTEVLSINWIFSIFNEENNTYFWENISLLQHYQQRTCIIDGGSNDKTCERLKETGHPYQILPGSTRGERFNFALQNDSSNILVFVHPRSKISSSAIAEIYNISSFSNWGGLTHKFDYSHPLLEFTSWWSNCVRGDIKGIFYLDHIIWCRRHLIVKIGGFPCSPIFEDTILSEKLLKHSKPTRINSISLTSASRFVRNGIIKQSILNQYAKILYYLGHPLDLVDSKYEKKLNLNRSVGIQTQHAPPVLSESPLE